VASFRGLAGGGAPPLMLPLQPAHPLRIVHGADSVDQHHVIHIASQPQ
jgi:hypothetical protein